MATDTQLLRIDWLDHSVRPAELIASFFWSEQLGLRATRDDLLGEIEQFGILRPDGTKVFPRDGRACFDALKWRASSFVEVTEARVVDATQSN